MSSQETIAHYRLLGKLGQGGMGIVYRAMDTKLRREVAIKVLPDEFANDPSRMARLAREARALASVNHPNIASIYGVEDLAIIMELVEGKTLSGPLPLETAIDYALQIAGALDCAHEKGIVHRDLKPSNIKVTPDGVVKVLDFGLAKATNADLFNDSATIAMNETRPGGVIGTTAYMSPEQARGKPVDKRADIWAFGVVLYEIITGKQLFEGETASDVLSAVLTRDIDWTPVPEQVRRLLQHCLERDVRKRLRDIGDVETLLETAPAVKAPRYERYKIAVAALAALSIALGVLFWLANKPEQHPLIQFSVDLGPEAIPASQGNLIAISPDGARLAYLVQPADEPAHIATRRLDEAIATPVPGTELVDTYTGMFFSPDGQSLGFFTRGNLKKVPVQGGVVATLCAATGARGAWWGPNGSIITTLSLSSGLFRIPDGGGTPAGLTDPSKSDEVTHRWPQVLPDGEAILFTGHRFTADYDEANIEVLSPKTGKWRVVQKGGYYGRYVATGHLLYASHSTLYAVPFDLNQLQVRGSPVPLVNDLEGETNSGYGGFAAENGMLVYFSSQSEPAKWPLTWIDGSGNQEPLPLRSARYVRVRISPDSSKLAIRVEEPGTGSVLEIYDLRRDTTTRLTSIQNASDLTWTPDGKHIAYVSTSARSLALRWTRADGAGETTTLVESRNQLHPGNFLPGASRLVYSDGYHIWTLPLDLSDPDRPKPGKPEPFGGERSTELEPAFSPDGRWIAYGAANEAGGRFDIFVRPFPAPANGASYEWEIAEGGAGPFWSNNGRELFYRTVDGQIMVVPYTASNGSFAAGKPRLWCSKRLPERAGLLAYDLSPDGKRILMATLPPGAGRSSAHVTVMLNFFDELRRRVPVQ